MINQKKHPNQFAPLSERQLVTGYTLPNTLNNKFNEFVDYTQEIRQLLIDGLPQEIIDTLWVVKYEHNKLTISVTSHTAANHLRYLATTLVQLIKDQSRRFQHLDSVEIIVSYATSVPSTSSTYKNQETVNKVEKRLLSSSTRKTIAHTANHVIKDQKLKQALLKLANCDT